MDHVKKQEQPAVRPDGADIDSSGRKMKIEVRRLERIAAPGEALKTGRGTLSALLGLYIS